MKPPVLLYCHCQYAQVLPEAVKKETLKQLSDSGQPFEAVPDLCELSARRDPALARIAAAGPVKIAACFPRAVKWLFHSAGAPLSVEETQIVNMRTLAATEAGAAMLSGELAPNLPSGKVTKADAPVPDATPVST
jgi:hypothetical protein